MTDSLCESLRQTADRVRGWSYSGDAEPDPRVLMREAATRIEDATSALRYIEQEYGRLAGVGWDRVLGG